MNNLRTTEGRSSFSRGYTSLRSWQTRNPAKMLRSAKRSIIACFLFFILRFALALPLFRIRSDVIGGAYICTNVFHSEDEVLLLGSTSVYQWTTTYIRTSLLSFWMLGWDGKVWCLPVTFVTQVELCSDQSIVFGQPRARVQIVHEYNPIHFVLVTPNRRCSYLQLGRTSSLILHTNCSSGPSVWTNCPLWLVSGKLRDLTVDDMLTYSLKALHVGAHATANIRLMSYSKLRVDAHVLLNIGCFYWRSDRNGLSVGTHMDGEAPDQDRSRRSKWFTVRPRKFITLGHVSIATGRRRARPGSFPVTGSSSGDPNSFLCAVQHVSLVIHALFGRVVWEAKKWARCESVCRWRKQYGLQSGWPVFTVIWKAVSSLRAWTVSSFRNSSVFSQYAVDESHEWRQAFLEVDALLDHLFRHVRRFVTSNPLRRKSDILWLPFDVKRMTVNRILTVTAISVQ